MKWQRIRIGPGHMKDKMKVRMHPSGANPDGLVIHEELLCMNCGKYTQYHYDDRV